MGMTAASTSGIFGALYVIGLVKFILIHSSNNSPCMPTMCQTETVPGAGNVEVNKI